MLKIGERLVVQGLVDYPATVEKIWFDEETQRTVIELDWGIHGKSRVYDHDENKIWYRYTEAN
jgi:hypothetical protein